MKTFLTVLGAIALAACNMEAQNLSQHNRVLSPSSPVAQAAPTLSADSSPQATPCVVTLFNNYVFQDYSAQYFTYTPTCPGPWSKVLFKGSFNVSEGIQYDRTANIQLGYVNIYFGTTEEPSPTSAPSWTVQRDLTDYSSIFVGPQSGEVDIYNIVNSTYTGIIYGTATLEFYPVPANSSAPIVADALYPLPNGPGAPYQLSNSSSLLSETFTLPTNVERAYLDVISQGQSGDEFWYLCVPNDVTGELESCGNTAFRETEISIDGQPAGVAPIYPWIFTGGIDPYLWIPIPGVQTLNFAPYRVDLTPFAATLSNGLPHTVSIGVYNANGYFQATGTLLVYLDHGSTTVTGGLLANTLTAPNPVVNENINTDPSGNVTGTVSVTSDRSYVIAGYVNTSHGKITTALSQAANFSNVQNFNITDTVYVQDATQKTAGSLLKSVTVNGVTSQTTSQYQFPLVVNIDETTIPTGYSILTTINQNYQVTAPSSSTESTVRTTDTLLLDSNFEITGNTGQKSQSIFTQTTNGTCSGLLLTAANNQYTGAKKNPNCP